MLIEKTVIRYLEQKLNINEVYAEIPEEMPKRFIVVGIVDRGKTNHIDAATIELMSYANDKLGAAELDELVRNAMEQIIELDSIFSSRLGGGGDEQDTALKKYRYRSYYNLFF